MRLNSKTQTTRFTHEGAPAAMTNPEQDLRRSVMACLLWEDGFYEDGQEIGQRIADLVAKVPNPVVAEIAIEARNAYRLRHVPLLLVREMARKGGKLVSETLAEVIQRPDELAEFMAIYWKDGRQPLSKQVKLGLAQAFTKFDEYQLAKYNRDGAIRLRDVLFLCHAKPKDDKQEALWRRLVENTLATPDTWEVALAGGADKKDTFVRLIQEKKLGYMALLRNLRNMREAGVAKPIVGQALVGGARYSKALPFRYVAAMKAVPQWEDVIESAMLEACQEMPKLTGKTVIVVDCSGSMSAQLSTRSQLTRFEAAAALAILVREIADEVSVYAYGSKEEEIAPRRGMALRDALRSANVGWATDLGRCIKTVNKEDYDRVIVITDEQSHTAVPGPKGRGYVVNVATYKNGIGYGPWVHIDGFSEAVIRFIQEYELDKPV